MKSKHARIAVQVILVVFLAFLLISCGESGGSHHDDSDEGSEGGTNGGVTVNAIGVVAEQNSINPGDSTSITAMAYDSSGHGISNQAIEFKLDDPTLGSITGDGTTNSDGTFTADFQARQSTGTVNVTAMCGSATSSPLEITIKEQFVENISLSANPTTISVTNTATVTAEVTDEEGQPVANGTTVNFSLQDSAFGSITQSASTNAGRATATFTAANFPGTATINAASGSASASADIVIEPAQAASIEFDSVSKNPIAIRGTGGQEYGNVTFNVKDVNGNPAEDIDVLFTMVSGIQGEEYLEEDDDTPYTQTVGTSGGTAEITLHSGYEAGTVSIKASITTAEGETISAKTPVISIGGGVPNDDWFTVSVKEPGWNMGGLACVGVETEITAWLADRFGNYNVLDGHNVFFESEVGLAAYPTASTEGENGSATSTVRTQSANSGKPKDVVPEAWEEALKEEISTEFDGGVGAPLPSGHPRDGVCSVLVFTKGEESFVDGSNGGRINGLYDTGEAFDDTADDPWRDYDDDGLWDNGSETTPLTEAGGTNPEEDAYQDRAGNDQWDGPNGVWDGPHPDSDQYEVKDLFRQVDFLITGLPYVRFDRPTFEVPDGGSATVKILICDMNYNRLSAGSTYTVSVDVGKITSEPKSFEYPSSSFYGSETETDWNGDGKVDEKDYMPAHRALIVNEVTISDDDPGDTDPPEQAELTVTVIWKSNGGCADDEETLSISGTVD